MTDWLSIHRGDAPLVLAFPHTGTEIPADIEARFVSPALARKDADWWIDILYGFAADLDATIVRTAISRTVIDVNRDPSGVSLYPGQATTDLFPTETFRGQPLYRNGDGPSRSAMKERLERYWTPYHQKIESEPWLKIIDWRKASSALSPITMASTSGAIG